jgi:hypothetical protein
MMDREELELKIDGPARGIDAHAVVDGLQALLRLLESLAVESPRDQLDETKAFSLAGLSIGSAKVTISGNRSRVRTALDGLQALGDRADIPAGWGTTSIHALLDLGRVRNRRGVSGLEIKATDALLVRIDDLIIANAAKSLRPATPSLGSVRGTLFRYNDHGRNAGIRDDRTGLVANIDIPTHLVQEFVGALTAEVQVWGEVYRTTTGKVDHVRAEGISKIGPPKPRPSDAVTGIFGSNWTRDLDSVDWVRGQRGE